MNDEVEILESTDEEHERLKAEILAAINHLKELIREDNNRNVSETMSLVQEDSEYPHADFT